MRGTVLIATDSASSDPVTRPTVGCARQSARPYARPMPWTAAGTSVVAIGYAAVAAIFTPLTWPAMLATLPPLVVAGWAAVRVPDRPAVASVGRGRVAPWVAVVVAGTIWELVALVRSPRADYPTISSIVSPVAGTQWWFRFVGYLLWFAVGAWLLHRSRAPIAGAVRDRRGGGGEER